MDPIEQLESVLCAPDGKCCIAGSDSDRAIVDEALADLKVTIAQPEQAVASPALRDAWLRAQQAEDKARRLEDAFREKELAHIALRIKTEEHDCCADDLRVLATGTNALLHQIDIGDFVDSNGHSAKMLKPVHDLMKLLSTERSKADQGEAIAQPAQPAPQQAVQERGEVSYEVVQEGYVVASAEGPNAASEISKYAAQYAEDGPVQVFTVIRRNWKGSTAEPQGETT
jgi:hypothetical protein